MDSITLESIMSTVTAGMHILRFGLHFYWLDDQFNGSTQIMHIFMLHLISDKWLNIYTYFMWLLFFLISILRDYNVTLLQTDYYCTFDFRI